MDGSDLIGRLYQNIGNTDSWNRVLEEIDQLPEPERQALSHHITKAWDIHLKLDGWRLSLTVWKAVLDHLASPVILVDRQASLLHTNQAGQRALESADYLSSRQGKVEFQIPIPQKPSLAAMIASVWGSNSPRGHAARVVAADGRVAVLTIRALKNLPAGPSYGRAEAALFLSMPRPSFDAEVLQTVFDLTPAEARLAEQLVWGEELSTLAERWNLSRETLKSQLDRLFHKTGTHRQTQLVAVLLSVHSMGLW